MDPDFEAVLRKLNDPNVPNDEKSCCGRPFASCPPAQPAAHRVDADGRHP
jgi:hypothetical protein